MNEDLNDYELALNLAENISANINPRPPVGAIIKNNGEILGKGVTEASPGNHAEINAIINCENNNILLMYLPVYQVILFQQILKKSLPQVSD